MGRSKKKKKKGKDRRHSVDNSVTRSQSEQAQTHNLLRKYFGIIATLIGAPIGVGIILFFVQRSYEMPSLEIAYSEAVVSWSVTTGAVQPMYHTTVRDLARNCNVVRVGSKIPTMFDVRLPYIKSYQLIAVVINSGQSSLHKVLIAMESQSTGLFRIWHSPNSDVTPRTSYSLDIRQDIIEIESISPKDRVVIKYEIYIPQYNRESDIDSSLKSPIDITFLGSTELPAESVRPLRVPHIMTMAAEEAFQPFGKGLVLPTDGIVIDADTLPEPTSPILIELEGSQHFTTATTCTSLNASFGLDTLRPILESIPTYSVYPTVDQPDSL